MPEYVVLVGERGRMLFWLGFRFILPSVRDYCQESRVKMRVVGKIRGDSQMVLSRTVEAFLSWLTEGETTARRQAKNCDWETHLASALQMI